MRPRSSITFISFLRNKNDTVSGEQALRLGLVKGKMGLCTVANRGEGSGEEMEGNGGRVKGTVRAS